MKVNDLSLTLCSFLPQNKTMLAQSKEENLDIIESLAEYVKKKGYEDIRVDVLEGFEAPSKLVRKNSDTEDIYIPDVTASKRGRKDYFEVALKGDSADKLASKWQLLGTIAKMKRGDLYIVVPKGHFRFTADLVKKYSIEAEIIKF